MSRKRLQRRLISRLATAVGVGLLALASMGLVPSVVTAQTSPFDAALSFATISGVLSGEWPKTEAEFGTVMAEQGFRRVAGLQWEIRDSTGHIVVRGFPEKRWAMITFEPPRLVAIEPALLSILASKSVSTTFDGPDEVTLAFNGTLLDVAKFTDEIGLSLPRGVWKFTTRNLHVAESKP
jgi:hypothetical protein